MTDDPELRIATSLIDYIFRRLALDYLPLDVRAELGVLSANERIQPTLPGVEEAATPSSSTFAAATSMSEISELPIDLRATPAPAPSSTPTPVRMSRERPADAPFCFSCGNEMQRGWQLLRVHGLRQHERLQLT